MEHQRHRGRRVRTVGATQGHGALPALRQERGDHLAHGGGDLCDIRQRRDDEGVQLVLGEHQDGLVGLDHEGHPHGVTLGQGDAHPAIGGGERGGDHLALLAQQPLAVVRALHLAACPQPGGDRGGHELLGFLGGAAQAHLLAGDGTLRRGAQVEHEIDLVRGVDGGLVLGVDTGGGLGHCFPSWMWPGCRMRTGVRRHRKHVRSRADGASRRRGRWTARSATGTTHHA